MAVSFLALIGPIAAACSSSQPASTSTTPGGNLSGPLTVSAAASLQAAFTDIKAAFELAYPDVTVTVNFGASSTLAQQIKDGAPVDVFASADEANMAKVSDARLLSDQPTLFATNSLEIIVRKGNPTKISVLSDLSRSGLIYVTCAPEVPIGKYGAQVLQKAGVTVKPASLEPDVKGIVTKVTSGEADAGIVYATDITATNGAADGVPIPAEINVTAKYPIAPIATSTHTEAAAAWIAFVAGANGQAILQSYGFKAP
jgi:molybdate transport system substrate-binding protein